MLSRIYTYTLPHCVWSEKNVNFELFILKLNSSKGFKSTQYKKSYVNIGKKSVLIVCCRVANKFFCSVCTHLVFANVYV